MVTSPRLVQSDPLPVTSTRLLLLAARNASVPLLFSTYAPLLTTSRLNAPLLPAKSEPLMIHRAVGLTSRTSLDLDAAFSPMTPLSALISDALLEITSSENELLLPTVVSPGKELVALLNVLVVPSTVNCARSAGAANRIKDRSSGVVFIIRVFVFALTGGAGILPTFFDCGSEIASASRASIRRRQRGHRP